MKYPLIALLLLFTLLFGCAEQVREPAKPLVETHWLFLSLDGDTTGINIHVPRPYMLIRPGEQGLRFQVYGGCNNMLGHVVTDSMTTLKFSRIASTRKMCPDMRLEEKLQAVLPEVDGFQIEGRQLTLRTKGSTRAVLEAGEVER